MQVTTTSKEKINGWQSDENLQPLEFLEVFASFIPGTYHE
jgi:hypothetical protein